MDDKSLELHLDLPHTESLYINGSGCEDDGEDEGAPHVDEDHDVGTNHGVGDEGEGDDGAACQDPVDHRGGSDSA